MPARSEVIGSPHYRLIDLGVSKGFVLSFIPPETPESTQIVGNFLFSVVAESVLQSAVVLMQCNSGRRIGTRKKSFYGLAICAHVCAVGIEEHSLHAFVLCDKIMPILELAILPVGSAEGPVEIDAVRYRRHCENSVPQTPRPVVILD